MEQIRCFIAIELTQEIKAELTRLKKRLKTEEYPEVKWVDPEAIHLTLKFLGNVPSDQLPHITRMMSQVGDGASPFWLEIGGLGAFPNQRQPRVVWVGLGGELAKLAVLQTGIDDALRPLGFASEARSFTPHLTLGRVKERASPPQRQQLGNLIAATSFEPKLKIKVVEFSLMRSQLTPAGPIYSRLASFPLAMPTAKL